VYPDNRTPVTGRRSTILRDKMRLWSIHPKYLDSKGLVALWREALLAKKVLMGNTSGYKNHPQLMRFKSQKDPVQLINQYLEGVYDEACRRGYSFDKVKIDRSFSITKISVTRGQIEFERMHLLNKLKNRDKDKCSELLKQKEILPHPVFKITEGEIEKWEKTND